MCQLHPCAVLGDFHDAHKGEMAGGLLSPSRNLTRAGIRPIACGDLWRRCFASLAANSLRSPLSKIFTTTYPNFMQTANTKAFRFYCCHRFFFAYFFSGFPGPAPA